MSLFQKIQDDLKVALKSGDRFIVDTLRFINASLHNKSIEKRGRGQPEELTDEEVIDVLGKEAKKRQDAIALYIQGNRPELAEKEKNELELIQKYLPSQMSREEVAKKVEEILATLQQAQGDGQLNFGQVMKAVMAELKGKADAKVISEIIKQAKPGL